MPGSPADEAGIRADDLITAIDRVAARTLSRADAAAALRDSLGKTLLLSGTFGGVPGIRTISLRDLLPP
jgi:C-terminal processing protease CtpA/Prc